MIVSLLLSVLSYSNCIRQLVQIVKGKLNLYRFQWTSLPVCAPGYAYRYWCHWYRYRYIYAYNCKNHHFGHLGTRVPGMHTCWQYFVVSQMRHHNHCYCICTTSWKGKTKMQTNLAQTFALAGIGTGYAYNCLYAYDCMHMHTNCTTFTSTTLPLQ